MPYHQPVLLAETLHFLAPKPGETHLDATLGGGGHSRALAEAIQPQGTLIGLDRDVEALQAAEAQLADLRGYISIILLHTPFGKMEEALNGHSETKNLSLDGVLFDLGVSSHQLDTARGFSFRREEALDMRMDTSSGMTAAQLLAQVSEAELSRILWEYGEERWAKRIAHHLVAQRQREPIQTTAQLAALVERSIPRKAWPKEIHVATRTFQAIRIALNDELGQLEAGLQAAVSRLKPGGRMVVISYHSLEDRIVKRAFAEWAGRSPSPSGYSPAALLPNVNVPPTLALLTTKPVVPNEQETIQNPRARSARLRAAQKL